VPDRPSRRARDRARAVAAAVCAFALLGLATLSGCGSDSETTQGSTAGGGTLSNNYTTNSAAPAIGATKQKPAPGGIQSSLTPTEQVDLAIKSVLASGVPDLACRQYSTARYVKTTFGDRAGCVTNTLPASAAQSIKEKKIEIKGDKAEATIVPTGGPSDGETIKVTLVRQGTAWKVDTLKSNAPVGP
jgi:hypothetical protein